MGGCVEWVGGGAMPYMALSTTGEVITRTMDHVCT